MATHEETWGSLLEEATEVFVRLAFDERGKKVIFKEVLVEAQGGDFKYFEKAPYRVTNQLSPNPNHRTSHAPSPNPNPNPRTTHAPNL